MRYCEVYKKKKKKRKTTTVALIISAMHLIIVLIKMEYGLKLKGRPNLMHRKKMTGRVSAH